MAKLNPMKKGYFPIRILMGCLVLAIVAEAHQLHRLKQINLKITQPENISVTDNSPTAIIFAKAWHLNRSGQFQEALRLYNSIENRVTPENLEKINYNIGQIYLTQAARHWNTQGVRAYSQVLTWSSLAKKTFRKVVNANPSNWDARFNLEYTLRLSPPPRKVDKADWTGHKSSVHSVYPGIPVGGP